MHRRTLLAGLALALAACSGGIVPEAAEAAARTAFDRLRARDYAALQAMFTDELQGPQLAETLQLMRAAVPDGTPASAKSIGWEAEAKAGEGRRVVLTHAYEYPGRTVKVETVMVPAGEAWKLAGMHVDLPGS